MFDAVLPGGEAAIHDLSLIGSRERSRREHPRIAYIFDICG
jgi:hypothetical protein